MFEDSALYNALNNRKDKYSKIYSSEILKIADTITPVLDYIRIKFPNYPDHGIDHSCRILRNIGKIIEEESIEKLSSMDIFILFLSSLFHDVGMSRFNLNMDQDDMRNNHHYLSKDVIECFFEKYMIGFDEYKRIQDAVVFVCEAHGLALEEMVNDKRFNYEDSIDDSDIHYGVLAFLLRIGDLMDIEASRVNRFRMELFSDTFSETSKNHNERSLNVVRYVRKPSLLEIVVKAENVDQYIIWSKWFSWLRIDIEKFDALFSCKFFRLPIPETEIINPNENDYHVTPIEIKIDDNGRLWDLVTKSIYTNELDFLREMIQNSIDASLKSVYLDNKINIEECSPRSWGTYANGVDVFHSRSKNLLCVSDHGIGMDEKDLDNYLFKLSASEIAINEKRKFPFPGIAKFGIGFVSCLIGADKIVILSSKSRDVLFRTTLETNSNSAIIEKISNPNDYVGTTVILYLKSSISSERIAAYLENTFKYPSVPISFYPLDDISEHLCMNTRNEINQMILSQPYMIPNYLIEKKPEIDQLANELAMQELEIMKEIEELSKQVPPYLRTLSSNNEMLKYIRGPLDDDTRWMYLKAYDKERRLIRTIEGYAESLKYLKGPAIYYNETVDIEQGDTWDCIFWDFEKYPERPSPSVIKSEINVSLAHKTGILIVKFRIADLKVGVEGVSINFFMLSDGEVVQSLNLKSNEEDEGIDLIIKDNAIKFYADKEITTYKFPYSSFRSVSNCPYDVSNKLHNIGKCRIYQDGIYVSNRMIDIFPFCVSRFFCNLTADSRLKLNVSRHDISEMPADMNSWLICSGKIIQKQLFDDLKTTFNKLDVKVNTYTELIRLDYKENFPKYYESIVMSLSTVVGEY